MTRDDIIRMAQEAGITFDPRWGTCSTGNVQLERFAALVAKAERERIELNAIHSCHAECQNPFCVRVREEVEHEREACAKLCEDIPLPQGSTELTHLPTIERCAAAIRARGEP
jgi:hypothetical protein